MEHFVQLDPSTIHPPPEDRQTAARKGPGPRGHRIAPPGTSVPGREEAGGVGGAPAITSASAHCRLLSVHSPYLPDELWARITSTTADRFFDLLKDDARSRNA